MPKAGKGYMKDGAKNKMSGVNANPSLSQRQKAFSNLLKNTKGPVSEGDMRRMKSNKGQITEQDARRMK